MAIKGLTLTSVERYVSDLDPAKKAEDDDARRTATVFLLGNIDQRTLASLQDESLVFFPGENETAATQIKMNGLHYSLVQYGLRGWENFQDDDGDDIKFKTVKRTRGDRHLDVVHPDCMERLGSDLIRELGSRIRERNSVSREEAGNSVAA